MSEPLPQIETIDTICRHCVFAEWDLFPNNETQIGCNLDLLDKYSAVTDVEDVIEEDYKYKKIRHRMCIGCRGKSWQDKYKDNLYEQIKQEWRVEYTTLLVFNEESVIEDLQRSVGSINELKNQPSKVIVVSNNANYKIFDIKEILKTLKCKWRISAVQQDFSIEYFIDCVAKEFEGIYTSIYMSGAMVYDIFDKLTEDIRLKLHQVVMITPDDEDNGLTILNKAYEYFGGMKYGNIIDKIKQKAEEDKCTHLIRPIKDFL